MTAPVQRLRQEITIEYGEVLRATVDAADLAAVLDAAEALAAAGARLRDTYAQQRSIYVINKAVAGLDAALARWRELTGEGG